MKIRNGFVSNSSSSSFIVAYSDEEYRSYDDPLFMRATLERRIYEHDLAIAASSYGGEDGIALIIVNDEVRNFIIENELWKKANFVDRIYRIFTAHKIIDPLREDFVDQPYGTLGYYNMLFNEFKHLSEDVQIEMGMEVTYNLFIDNVHSLKSYLDYYGSYNFY